MSAVQRTFKILCVDDEPAIREVLALLLRREGHRVEIAHDGLAAWLKMEADPNAYEIVISDNEMPNLTGLGFIARIRERGFDGKVVMFSGSLADPTQLNSLRVSALVPKGDPMALLKQIRTLAGDGEKVLTPNGTLPGGSDAQA